MLYMNFMVAIYEQLLMELFFYMYSTLDMHKHLHHRISNINVEHYEIQCELARYRCVNIEKMW